MSVLGAAKDQPLSKPYATDGNQSIIRTYESYLKTNEVAKLIEFFQTLPENLKRFCITLVDDKHMTLLHKLSIRNLNNEVLKIFKLLPMQTQELCLSLKDKYGWTFIDYATQNNNASLKRNILTLIDANRYILKR